MELMKFEIARAEIDYRAERTERYFGRRPGFTRAQRRRSRRPLLGHHSSEQV
ncbi:MAG TPA: hypothetical protein VFK34_04540 [Marmoricola sp.]|jgi:hypothetical protein|nr:hypothetical protein [Marmoricola sp.]